MPMAGRIVSGTRVLIEIAGEVGLLLWGTHMVSTGVQRGYGTALRRALERNLNRRWLAFLTGVGVTTLLLQSSTATGLMAMSFAAAGVIALQPALAVMLGANVGTALVAQVLSFDVSVIASPIAGGGTNISVVAEPGQERGTRSHRPRAHGHGAERSAAHARACRKYAAPLRSILQSLNNEPLLAVLIASLLTWACHSSVAIVLLVASLAGTHLLAAPESLALVLGANLGGAMPALIHASTPVARRLPLGNLLVRLVGVLILLPFLPATARLLRHAFASDARLPVDFHLAFNLALALVGFCRRSGVLPGC